jgi:GDP-L-fucose synthase
MTSKRVLVTGGTGFLGSFVCERLKKTDWVGEIIVPRHAEYDLRDQRAVKAMYTDHHPEIVIHCAGHVGGIKDAREHPADFFYDNLMMGVNVQHGAYEAKVEKFIGVGSVCAYPEWAPIPLKEETLWDGYPEKVNAPYGVAKKMLLVQGNAYRQQYGFRSIHLLLVNLYGPRDNFDPETSHVIPGLIRKFLEAKETGASSVTLWGDGSPTREFLYAADAANGIVLAAEKYDAPDPVNLGSGQEIAVRDLATVIAADIGYTGEILWNTSVPNGQPRRCLDTSRAEKEFGFRAAVPLKDGIRETIEWYKGEKA